MNRATRELYAVTWQTALIMVLFSAVLVGSLLVGYLVIGNANADPREPEAQPCAVQVVIDLTTYDGPKHFENFCLSQPALYGNGLLSVEAVSMGDGIFRDGFDGTQP